MEHSGLLTADSLVDVFQSLAKISPQGILQVSSFEKNLEIWIDEGIIVAVKERKISLANTVIEKLHEAARISFKPDSDDVQEVLAQLEEEISLNEFLLAKRTVELDLLYSLRKCSDDSFYKFNACLFGPEDLEDCTLSIPPSKLLLDFFELEPLDLWFEDAFPNSWQQDVQLERKVLAGMELTADEELLKSSIETSSAIREVYEKSLLTELEFKSALRSLHNKVLEVGLNSEEEEGLPVSIQPKVEEKPTTDSSEPSRDSSTASPLVTTNEPVKSAARDTMSMTIKRKWSMFNFILSQDSRVGRVAQGVAGVCMLGVMLVFSKFVGILHEIFLLFTNSF